MSAAFKVGDAVIIQGVLHPIARPHIGRRGTMVAVDSSGTYVVAPDGASPIWVYATEVKSVIETPASAKDQSDYATGDTVRIVQTHCNDGRNRASIGKVGTIENILYRNGRPDTFFVGVDGEMYHAAQVEKVADPTPEPGPYTVRLQAAKDAVAVIGDGASIEEITALAEWMLSVPKLRAVLGGAPEETEQSFSFGYLNRYVFGGSVGPLVEAPEASKSGTLTDITKAQLIAGEPLTIRNLDVELDTSFTDDDIVEVSLDGISTYLADDDINELVDYLRAAQVVQAARRAASES